MNEHAIDNAAADSGAAPSACCDTVLLSACCEPETKPVCCGPEKAPRVCGCGGTHASGQQPADRRRGDD